MVITAASPRLMAQPIQHQSARRRARAKATAAVNDVDRWFERTARGGRQPVSLYACLLTGRLSAYFAYRLRYPFLITTIRFAVHVVEFFVLLSSLGGVAAFTVMVLRAGSMIVAGGWWGLLEVMRERLRRFAQAGKPDASEREIGSWLFLGTVVAAAVILVAAVMLLVFNVSGNDPVARVYAFLIVVELAIDFPVRVLHSGVYATRRVHKPIWSMFIPILAQLVILVPGLYLYPGLAIVASIIVSNAIGVWLTVHYCVEMYRLTGLRPKLERHHLWRQLPDIPLRLGLETSLSGLSLRLDAVIVLALVGFYGTSTRAFDLTAGMTSWQRIDAFQFFYLILPLFRGTYESAGIFYFDLVRMRRTPALRELQLLFFRRLLLITPVIAMFFWLLTAGLGVFVLRDVPISFLLALIPMFMARSAIGVYQMRLFAEGRFGTHLATLALLAVLMWLVWINPNPAGDLVQITAAMLLQLVVLIDIQHLRDRRDPPLPPLVSARALAGLVAEPASVSVGALDLPASTTSRQRTEIVHLMRETLDGRGHFAFRSPSDLVFCEKAPGPLPASTALAVQERTGFAARAVRSGGAGSTRVEAPANQDDLADCFRSLFPGGAVFNLETLEGARELRSADSALLATALSTAASSLEDGLAVVPLCGRWITPVFRGATLQLLLIAPDCADPVDLKTWERTVKAWNRG